MTFYPLPISSGSVSINVDLPSAQTGDMERNLETRNLSRAPATHYGEPRHGQALSVCRTEIYSRALQPSGHSLRVAPIAELANTRLSLGPRLTGSEVAHLA